MHVSCATNINSQQMTMTKTVLGVSDEKTPPPPFLESASCSFHSGRVFGPFKITSLRHCSKWCSTSCMALDSLHHQQQQQLPKFFRSFSNFPFSPRFLTVLKSSSELSALCGLCVVPFPHALQDCKRWLDIRNGKRYFGTEIVPLELESRLSP